MNSYWGAHVSAQKNQQDQKIMKNLLHVLIHHIHFNE